MFSCLQYLLDHSASCRTTHGPQYRVHVVWVAAEVHLFSVLYPALWARLAAAADTFQLHFFATTLREGSKAATAIEGAVRVHPGRPQWHELFPQLLSCRVPLTARPLGTSDLSEVSVLSEALLGSGEAPSESSAADVPISGHGAAVLACGPAPMVADVQQQAVFYQAAFHAETFAL